MKTFKNIVIRIISILLLFTSILSINAQEKKEKEIIASRVINMTNYADGFKILNQFEDDNDSYDIVLERLVGSKFILEFYSGGFNYHTLYDLVDNVTIYRLTIVKKEEFKKVFFIYKD